MVETNTVALRLSNRVDITAAITGKRRCLTMTIPSKDYYVLPFLAVSYECFSKKHSGDHWGRSRCHLPVGFDRGAIMLLLPLLLRLQI